MAPVPLKRKRDTSNEPKTDPVKRAYMLVPTRRSCGSWNSTPIKRVSMARHLPATFAGRSSWCPELTPWLLLQNFAASRATPAAHQIVLRPAELHGMHSAAGPGLHARLQELDPPRGSQALRRVLLGSRVKLRTCQSGLQYRSAPTVAAVIRAHSSTERRQPATSSRWLALHRLERGGAA